MQFVFVIITSNLNESAVGFYCNTVNISNNVAEVGRGLENKIIQINLLQKKYFDKKETNERNIHDRLYLTRRQQEKKSRFKIKTMLNPLYNGAARRIQVTREERLALIVS